VNKYREGKIKRTLKRELKEREIVAGEAVVWAPLVFWGIPSLVFDKYYIQAFL